MGFFMDCLCWIVFPDYMSRRRTWRLVGSAVLDYELGRVRRGFTLQAGAVSAARIVHGFKSGIPGEQLRSGFHEEFEDGGEG